MGKLADYVSLGVIVLLGTSFLISGVLVNLIQFILWHTLRHLNLWLYRKINYYLLYTVWIQLVFLPEWWADSVCSVWATEDTAKHMGNEHAIVVMNHSFEIDWLMGWVVCEQNRLLGSSKGIVKKAIEKVPIIGWSWKFAESVFLERNWEKDKETMKKQLQNIGVHPDPIWLLLFAEGTRYTEDKYKASLEFAQKAGLTPLKNLLVPRTKGFTAAAQQLRGKFPAVYSATMCFDTREGAAKPTLLNLFLRRKIIADIALERFPLEQLPAKEEDISNWLHQSYVNKDELIEIYRQNGRFPDKFAIQRQPRRLWSLLNTLGWFFLIIPQLFRLFVSFLSLGPISLFIGFVLTLLVGLALQKLVGLTVVSKASSYGAAAAPTSSKKTS